MSRAQAVAEHLIEGQQPEAPAASIQLVFETDFAGSFFPTLTGALTGDLAVCLSVDHTGAAPTTVSNGWTTRQGGSNANLSWRIGTIVVPSDGDYNPPEWSDMNGRKHVWLLRNATWVSAAVDHSTAVSGVDTVQIPAIAGLPAGAWALVQHLQKFTNATPEAMAPAGWATRDTRTTAPAVWSGDSNGQSIGWAGASHDFGSNMGGHACQIAAVAPAA